MATSNSKNPPEKVSTSETITELAHRHLHDEGHTTTDEELRNAKVELTGNIKEDPENLFEVDQAPVTSPLQNKTEKDTNLKDEDKESDKDKKGDLPNPYTILP